MRFLAAVLLLGVMLRHTAHHWLAEGSRLSAAAWFYILGGVWEALLCGLLLTLLLAARNTLAARLAAAGAAIGLAEGLQLAVCRFPLTSLAGIPRGANLCDAATGLPVGAVMFSLYLLLLVFVVIGPRKKKP